VVVHARMPAPRAGWSTGELLCCWVTRSCASATAAVAVWVADRSSARVGALRFAGIAGLLVGAGCLATACTLERRPDFAGVVATTLGPPLPLDSLLPLQRGVLLREDSQRVIGAVQDASLDEDGSLYMADLAQRDVKVFDRNGVYIRSVGAFGGGPGEYRTPTTVRLSPFDTSLVVSDLVGAGLLIFDRRSGEVRRSARGTAGGVSRMSAVQGRGGEILVAGAPQVRADVESLAVAAILESDTAARILALLPREFQQKPYALNLVHGIIAQTGAYAYLAINAWPVLYRFRYDGAVVDSVRLPPAVFDGVQLPDTPFTDQGPASLRRFTQEHRWLRSLVPLSDSLFLVEISIYNADSEDWVRTQVLLSWSARPTARVSSPCECKVVSTSGGAAAFLVGAPGEGLRLELRSLPEWR
jgi:hypothetical protein